METEATIKKQRLMRDIAELQEKPYPNIRLQPIDLDNACLILTTEAYGSLHLRIHFGQFPTVPPRVWIQSTISHPNIFGGFICASILNSDESYTPAYTLKGICIQLLSFFASDSLEQEAYDGGGTVDLNEYRRQRTSCTKGYQCCQCGFDTTTQNVEANQKTESRRSKKRARREKAEASAQVLDSPRLVSPRLAVGINSLPDELLLQTTDHLDFEDLMSLSKAFSRMKAIIQSYDVIRCRELQCFILKQTYRQLILGVGVSVTGGKTIESEFDLLSGKAFHELYIRKSVHNIPFEHWLPLPISYPHWRKCQPHITHCLGQIALRMNLPSRTNKVNVIFAFMNDVIVKLNADLEKTKVPSRRLRSGSKNQLESKSTLRHASEKAIDSYFQLYHLLLCAATGPGGETVVAAANRLITSFMEGKRGKEHIPNLGHLLVALHISDVDVGVALKKAIITEAITRNVVWLLDGKGAGYAELGYLEGDEVSYYRLKRTFKGSKTSYCLLMFSELFRRTARPVPETGDSKKSLVELRDELFGRHGAPPPGAAAKLASEVKRLQKIDEFPSFLREMGLGDVIPGPKNFTEVLRETQRASIARGYSALTNQERLLSLRLHRDEEMASEPAIAKASQSSVPFVYTVADANSVASQVESGRLTFFPRRKQASGHVQQRRRN